MIAVPSTRVIYVPFVSYRRNSYGIAEIAASFWFSIYATELYTSSLIRNDRCHNTFTSFTSEVQRFTQSPPQSTPFSFPFFLPSLQVGARKTIGATYANTTPEKTISSNNIMSS